MLNVVGILLKTTDGYSHQTDCWWFKCRLVLKLTKVFFSAVLRDLMAEMAQAKEKTDIGGNVHCCYPALERCDVCYVTNCFTFAVFCNSSWACKLLAAILY